MRRGIITSSNAKSTAWLCNNFQCFVAITRANYLVALFFQQVIQQTTIGLQVVSDKDSCLSGLGLKHCTLLYYIMTILDENVFFRQNLREQPSA